MTVKQLILLIQLCMDIISNFLSGSILREDLVKGEMSLVLWLQWKSGLCLVWVILYSFNGESKRASNVIVFLISFSYSCQSFCMSIHPQLFRAMTLLFLVGFELYDCHNTAMCYAPISGCYLQGQGHPRPRLQGEAN